jgi:signal transduction histidine kinase
VLDLGLPGHGCAGRAGAALLVVGDEVRLRQVIGNLMSNALTHTPDGTRERRADQVGQPGRGPGRSAATTTAGLAGSGRDRVRR